MRRDPSCKFGSFNPGQSSGKRPNLCQNFPGHFNDLMLGFALSQTLGVYPIMDLLMLLNPSLQSTAGSSLSTLWG